jgi:hypothetical protein
LKSVSYDQKNVTEGFAEGVRLFLTQPETLEARAPKVFAWLESFAQDSHKYGPALRKAQADMTGMVRPGRAQPGALQDRQREAPGGILRRLLGQVPAIHRR